MGASRKAQGFVKTLKTLLKELDRAVGVQGAEGGKRRAGRPAKVRAETAAVILHLYKDQVRWLDDYAAWIATLAPDNARLSRVEVVRGLLLGLGEFTVKTGAVLEEGTVVRNERDLQKAVAAALAGGGKARRK